MSVKVQVSPLSGMYRRYPCQATAFAEHIFSVLEGSVPAQALDLLRSRRYNDLVSLRVDPSTYDESSSFRDAYLAAELMSKFPSWNIGIDRQQAALTAFEKAEMSCSEANLRLSRSYGVPSLSSTSVASYIYTARRKIARVLGPFDWDQAEQFFGFGPGATTHLKRKYGDAYYKFGTIPEVTKGCAALGYAALRRVPGWYNHLRSLSGSQDPLDVLKIVEGNRITTVPKNAKTDRVIAIEPLMNGFIQKGIGGLIRKRLRRVGIDLNSQEANQQLALEGSCTDKLATIDLSAASDTIPLRLVEELLPNDWFSAIEQARSPVGILPDGRKVSYQKVSSMGNGFTFELETLIFWSLCEAVLDIHDESERRLKVYGDDIVISSQVFEPLVGLLSFCGFTTNKKKSFASGPFRESCGKHYFMGDDVTPFYVRNDMVSPDRIILALNNLRRFAARGKCWGLDGRFLPVYSTFRNVLPRWLQRPRISDGYGDGALFGDFDEVTPRRAKWGMEGWEVDSVSFKKRDILPVDTPILLKALFRLEVGRAGVSLAGACILPRRVAGRENRMLVSHLRELALNCKRSELHGSLPLDVISPAAEGRYHMTKFTIPQWETKGAWL